MRKKIVRLAFIVMLLVVNQFMYGQKNFVQGLVVLNNGDTLRGQIDYRNWEVNPLNIQFQDNGGIKKFSPEDLAGFEILNEDIYISRTITKDMRPVNITDVLTKVISDTIVTERVFLRELFRGKNISLYELKDFKMRFYVTKNVSDSTEELLYKVYPNTSNTAIEERNIFRDQLTGIAYSLHASETMVKKTGKLSYEKTPLIRFVAELNNEKDPNIVIANKTNKRLFNNQFLIGGGVQFASFSFSGGIDTYNSLQFKNTVSSIIGFSYDLFSVRGQQRFGMRFELSYSTLHLKGESTGKVFASTVQRSYELSQANITPGVGVYYHFISNPKIRVYAGLGLATSLSGYSDVKMVEEYDDGRKVEYDDINPASMWFSTKLFLGVRIVNKINIGIATKITGDFFDRSGFNTKYPYVNFTVAYILTKVNKKK